MKGSGGMRVVLAVAVLGAVATACSGTGVSSDGGCAGPVLSVEPATAAPGDTVTVTGEDMVKGCADHHGVDSNGTGVSFESEAPMRDVEIDLVLAEDEWVTLATVDADDEGRFTVEVTLPATLAGAESALLEARGAHAEAVVALVP